MNFAFNPPNAMQIKTHANFALSLITKKKSIGPIDTETHKMSYIWVTWPGNLTSSIPTEITLAPRHHQCSIDILHVHHQRHIEPRLMAVASVCGLSLEVGSLSRTASRSDSKFETRTLVILVDVIMARRAATVPQFFFFQFFLTFFIQLCRMKALNESLLDAGRLAFAL